MHSNTLDSTPSNQILVTKPPSMNLEGSKTLVVESSTSNLVEKVYFVKRKNSQQRHLQLSVVDGYHDGSGRRDIVHVLIMLLFILKSLIIT